MKILYPNSLFLAPTSPIALTIGNFDGVHLGHQAVLHRLSQVASITVVFTFSNHPSEVLHKGPISRLTTLTHRLSLLEKMGVDYVILSPFTHAFSQQTAETFLTQLKASIPFSHLILGHDAVIGSDRRSDLQDLGDLLNFEVEYLEPAHKEGTIISSSEIRKSLLKGELDEVSAFLGRPYSISATVQKGHGMGKVLGFHTANLPVEELALPPLGVYAVEVTLNHEKVPAVANLGHAPTLHTNRPTCLEVHLIDNTASLYGQELEVFFLKFLRPERKFPSLEALQAQIHTDILCAKDFLLRI